MKILKVFGVVVGIHVFALILIFANPGCSAMIKTTPSPSDTVAKTDAPSPTDTSVNVVSGPTPHFVPMRVDPSSWVPGWTTVSRPMVTSTSIQVVAGSITVTPAR